MKKLLFLLVLACTSPLVRADVVDENEVDRGFKITNISQFPEYRFFYYYQTYYYDHGYQEGAPQRVDIVQDSVYYGGSRGNTALIHAEKTDGSGEATAAETVSGSARESRRHISGIVDVVEIVSVENGVITLKVKKEEVHYSDGTVKERKKTGAGFISGDGPGGANWWIWILPASALVALAAFYLWRKTRRVPAYADAAV